MSFNMPQLILIGCVIIKVYVLQLSLEFLEFLPPCNSLSLGSFPKSQLSSVSIALLAQVVILGQERGREGKVGSRGLSYALITIVN